MKKLLCLALLLTVTGCNGCTKTIHIIHDRDNPDDSMGIVVQPVPLPVPAPMPIPKMPPWEENKPIPLWRMWAELEDKRMGC